MIEGGGADELEFSKIDRLEVQGTRLKVTQRDGQTIVGQFLMPTDKPAEVRVLGPPENLFVVNPGHLEVDVRVPARH